MDNYLRSSKHKQNAKKNLAKGREKLRKKFFERQKEYLLNPNKCFYCNYVFEYENRYKKFCNSSCSAKFNNKGKKHSNETKLKISSKIKLKHKDNIKCKCICSQCSKEFDKKKYSKNLFCSNKCYNLYQKSPEYKEKARNRILERIENGFHKGFSTRYKLVPSFAENYFIDIFKKENISNYEREMKISINNRNMFVDFVFHKQMIALEIDGSHHNNKEQKDRDKIKDEFLISKGFEVIRIPWEGINSKIKLERLHNNINKLLKKIK